MPLPIAAFLPRVRQPGPPPHPQGGRSGGRSHPMNAEVLATCRTQVGQQPVAAPVRLAWQTGCAQRGAVPPERGPPWGQVLVGTRVIPRGGAPPLGLSGEGVAGGLYRRETPARGGVGVTPAPWGPLAVWGEVAGRSGCRERGGPLDVQGCQNRW